MSEKGCLYSTYEITSRRSSKFSECLEIINKSILAQSALLQNCFLLQYWGLELESSPKPCFLQPTGAGNPRHALLYYEDEKLQVPAGFSCLSKCCRLGEVSLSALPTWRGHQHHWACSDTTVPCQGTEQRGKLLEWRNAEALVTVLTVVARAQQIWKLILFNEFSLCIWFIY